MHRLHPLVREVVPAASACFSDSVDATRQHTVTLYSRPGCHLCEEAAKLLSSLSREFSFVVQECDISTSRELEARYDWLIPVIRFADGLEVCAPIIESELLAELRRRTGP